MLDVLTSQALLHASLEAASISTGKFSRWLRVLVTVLLNRGTEADRTKAVGYVEQAVTVIDGNQEEAGDDVHMIDPTSKIQS
jgi:hypothetical protein